MQGRYKVTHLPVTACFEGAEIVVQLGPDMPDWLKLGSRIGFFPGPGNGTYAEYSVGHINKILLLDEDATFEQGATFYVNPMTVIAMIHQVKEFGIKAINRSQCCCISAWKTVDKICQVPQYLGDKYSEKTKTSESSIT